MAKTDFRVVFDTNVLSPGQFDVLDNGPLRQLCKRGRVVPVYGHVFLEEVWRSYGSETKRVHLVDRWIPFIVDTVGRFCEDFDTIWRRELVQGWGKKTNIFMDMGSQRSLLRSLPHVPADGSWRAWHAAQAEISIEKGKRAAQRETSKEIREEVADWKKAVGYSERLHGKALPFEQLLKQDLNRGGRDFINALVSCRNQIAVADRWSRNKCSYPYFTTFVENMAYIGYHAATRPNDKIDLNAQADMDRMTHLLHADAIVSNETGFLLTAFNDIWGPRGKVIVNSQQFADFVAKLAA